MKYELYLCQKYRLYMLGLEIRCSECERRGDKPTLLGIFEGGEGVLRLWCKKCKREIRVEIKDNIVTTRCTNS